jgi:hypothetical protein
MELHIILHQRLLKENIMKNVMYGLAELFCIFFYVDSLLSMEIVINSLCKELKKDNIILMDLNGNKFQWRQKISLKRCLKLTLIRDTLHHKLIKTHG